MNHRSIFFFTLLLSGPLLSGQIFSVQPASPVTPVTPNQKSFTEQNLKSTSPPSSFHKPNLSLKEPLRPLTPAYIYTTPGTATWQGNEWVGSDNLYNLSKNIGIEIEVIAPSRANISLSEDEIKEKLYNLLKLGELTADSLATGVNPLPFLHVLIMVNPIEKGFAVYCAIRLFEQVDNKRVHFKPGVYWQAITWEKQELIITPPEALQSQVLKTLRDMARSFTESHRQKP